MQQTESSVSVSVIEPSLPKRPSFFSKILNRSIRKIQKSIDDILESRKRYLFFIIIFNNIWNAILIYGGYELLVMTNIPGFLAAVLLLFCGKFENVKFQQLTNILFYIGIGKVCLIAGLMMYCMILVILFREDRDKATLWGIRALWFMGSVVIDMLLMYLYTNVTLLTDVFIDLISQKQFYELRDMTKEDTSKVLDTTKGGDKSMMA